MKVPFTTIASLCEAKLLYIVTCSHYSQSRLLLQQAALVCKTIVGHTIHFFGLNAHPIPTGSANKFAIWGKKQWDFGGYTTALTGDSNCLKCLISRAFKGITGKAGAPVKSGFFELLRERPPVRLRAGTPFRTENASSLVFSVLLFW